MILFLCGTPGIGKTTVAKLLAVDPGVLHLETDVIRLEMGLTTTTSPIGEDAVNWRLFTRTVDFFRAHGQLAIIDMTGASRRLPYLRTALGEYPQTLVRLTSAFPYANCARKWGQAYSQDKFNHLHEAVIHLPADHELRVDGKTPSQTYQELKALLT